MKKIILFVLFALASTTALAGIREIAPGQDYVLAPNEGLIALVFDSNVPINSAAIKSVGQSGYYRIVYPAAAKTTRLLVATSGTYSWDELTLYQHYFPMRKDTDFSFIVKPGMINYPGDLVFRFFSFSSSMIHRSNRGLAIMDWLEKDYPQIAKRYSFEYAGQYPDVFPTFYKQERAANPGFTADKALPVKLSENLPLPPETLWQLNRVASISLSPDASYISEVINVNASKESLEIIDRKTGEVTVYMSFYDLNDLTWISNDTFVMNYDSTQLDSYVVFVQIVENNNGKLKFKSTFIPRSGNVIDPQLSNPDYFLFASWSKTDSNSVFVHRVSKRDTSLLTKPGSYTAKSRLNIALENDRAWLTNGQGEIAAAVVTKDKKSILMVKKGNRYLPAKELPEDSTFMPVAMSVDGQKIYALSDEGRTQRELILFDITGNTPVETIYSKPGADIDSVLLNVQRQPVGVTYYVDGQPVNEYFDSGSQKINEQLAAAFPKGNILVIDKDMSGNYSLIYVDSSTSAGSVYLFDEKKKTVEKIDDNAPWLSDRKFSASTTLKVKSRDGLTLEAYLTMPITLVGKLPPLVVMPHGGPIGIRDDRHFDRDVQFLASLGYAVLQVNFRGSDGFGKSFREAGKGSLGTAIEDDVDAVLTEVLNSQPVDKNQMCIVGMSYGGYSALVSSMRWPDRFKCAISFSGPTDRILNFSASDSVRSESVRKWMETYFGNPKTELEKMKLQQPLYSYKKLNTPVMLIHGTDDYRVDYEHVARLQRMLTIAGKPPVMLTLKNEGHGFSNQISKRISWSAIAGFLEQYLARPATPITVPAAAPATGVPATTTK